MTDKLNLAVFISGSGSNLKAILESCERPDFPARVRLVLSNTPDAKGLDHARHHNAPFKIIPHNEFQSRTDFDTAINSELQKHPIDLICLAGFMRVLGHDFVQNWAGRIINIHPSLLPKHKGLHTHQKVIEAGDDISGCSVHFVTAGLDDGPIILQKTVPVLQNDTPEILAKRVLEQEHIAYSEAIRLIAEGAICFNASGGLEIKNTIL